MDLSTPRSMEHEPDAPPKHCDQTPPPTFLTRDGTLTRLRPEVDVVLSLKNPTYKAVMLGYFQKLGEKNKSADKNNEEERKIAKEVLTLFKGRKKGEVARFFKPEARYSNRCFTEVDDKYALDKIMADIYRRMESASGWMENYEEAAQRKSPPPQDSGPPVSQANRPLSTVAATSPSPPNSAKKSKKRKPKKMPQSLPFLKQTIITDIIVGEELRAREAADGAPPRSPSDPMFHPLEVLKFFRALYVHGWEDWKKISKVLKTRSSDDVKLYADQLERRFPELRKSFSSKKVHKMQVKRGGALQPYRSAASAGGDEALQATPPYTDPAVLAASAMERMKREAPRPPKPRVVICLGNHVIDTTVAPSLVRRIVDQRRPTDTLPYEYDPSARPPVRKNSRQVFLPGNKAYARWLNKDDPTSYGTWYPGHIFASKIAPIQDERNNKGVHNLLYHMKFDDGAESLDLDTEDIIMRDQYEVWLKDLEHYYSLAWPPPNQVAWKRLKKGTRVYAKWVDPTDPELHGSWMPGKVHSSKKREGGVNRCHTYHILFDNGDQDVQLFDADVIEEEMYKQLLREKTERARKKPRLSGLDLITAASKMSSPIKSPSKQNGTSISAKRNIYSDGAGPFQGNELIEDLRCTEKLTSTPRPARIARISSTPSPDIHYGIYTKMKPWELERGDGSVPKSPSKSYVYATSQELPDAPGERTVQPTGVLSTVNPPDRDDPGRDNVQGHPSQQYTDKSKDKGAHYLSQECLTSKTRDVVLRDPSFRAKRGESQASGSQIFLNESNNKTETTHPRSDGKREAGSNCPSPVISSTTSSLPVKEQATQQVTQDLANTLNTE